MTQNSSALSLQYSSDAVFYKHSGAVPVAASIAGIVGGVVTAIVMGIAYAYADIYSPVDKLNLLITLVFGAVLGFVPAYLMHRTKARNLKFVVIIALCTALLGYYVCWVAWICAVADVPSGNAYLRLITHPRWMWEVIQGLNDAGTWSSGPVGGSSHNEPEHGTFLWIIWIAEAIGIFATAILAARAVGKGRPFCEECNAWCGDDKLLATLRADDVAGIKQRMLARDFVSLAANRVRSGDHYIAITQHDCPTCNQLNTLSATEITISYNKKGKATKNSKVLVNKLLVIPDELTPFTAPPPQPVAPTTIPTAPTNL